jgi:hypothetical protein
MNNYYTNLFIFISEIASSYPSVGLFWFFEWQKQLQD